MAHQLLEASLAALLVQRLRLCEGVEGEGGLGAEHVEGGVELDVGRTQGHHRDSGRLSGAARNPDHDGGVTGAVDRAPRRPDRGQALRSDEHTPELQSLMRISYAVFCLKKKNNT